MVEPAQLVGCEIVVPGSTSNLGPGFDALGLALRLYLRVRIEAAVDDGRGELRFTFDTGTPDGENVIATAIRTLAAARGCRLPTLDLRIASDIPARAGLGSSAAAIVAGLRIVQALDDSVDDAALLDAATRLEGHPDNVSASLLGGLTASAQTEDVVASACVPWPDRIGLVVATPDVALSTRAARAVLPGRVSRKDAVANLQRIALLLQALATGEHALIRHALGDRLHQPYRAPLVPGLDEAMAFDEPALLGVFLSGAGPSIAALVEGDPTSVEARFSELYARLGLGATLRRLDAHPPGQTRSVVARRTLHHMPAELHP